MYIVPKFFFNIYVCIVEDEIDMSPCIRSQKIIYMDNNMLRSVHTETCMPNQFV